MSETERGIQIEGVYRKLARTAEYTEDAVNKVNKVVVESVEIQGQNEKSYYQAEQLPEGVFRLTTLKRSLTPDGWVDSFTGSLYNPDKLLEMVQILSFVGHEKLPSEMFSGIRLDALNRCQVAAIKLEKIISTINNISDTEKA